MGDWYQQWIAFSSDEVVTPYRAIPWRRGLHTQRQKKSISLPWMVAFQAAMSVMGVIASSWALKTKSPKRPPIGSSNTKPVHPPPRELASSRSAVLRRLHTPLEACLFKFARNAPIGVLCW